MDKKFLSRLAIIFAILSMVSYFTSVFPLVITAFGALAVSIFVVKDRDVIVKVMDPVVTVTSVSLVSLVFTILYSIIDNISSLGDGFGYDFNKVLGDIFRVVNLIFTVFMIIMIVIAIVSTIRGKRIPVFSKITDKIMGIVDDKKSNQDTADKKEVKAESREK
ncbi:MAG: hypothetical protein E7361_03330 [Clostridiales bacterium]|nr:hypothetical protein [Clostridiales bacterium]